MKRTKLYLSDIITGVIAELAQRGIDHLPLKRNILDHVFAALIAEVQQQAGNYGLKVDARVRPHPIYGDSPTLRHELISAAQRGLVSLEYPQGEELRINISAEQGQELIRHLPGTSEFYQMLGNKYVERMRKIDFS